MFWINGKIWAPTNPQLKYPFCGCHNFGPVPWLLTIKVGRVPAQVTCFMPQFAQPFATARSVFPIDVPMGKILKLDDGGPESEKEVFQAALRMVIVKDSRWIVGEFYMSYGKIWCEKVRLIKKRILGKGHQMTRVLQPQRERGKRERDWKGGRKKTSRNIMWATKMHRRRLGTMMLQTKWVISFYYGNSYTHCRKNSAPSFRGCEETRRFHTETLLYRDAFTHRRFYTQTVLHTDAFTKRRFYTHKKFYTQTLLHTDTFTHRPFYTHIVLHTNAFTHKGFYTQKFLHTDTFTHRRFYTQTLFAHRHIYTQKLLHQDVFPHRNFYSQALVHTDVFIDKTSYTQALLQDDAFTTHTNTKWCFEIAVKRRGSEVPTLVHSTALNTFQ